MIIGNDWDEVLGEYFGSPEFKSLIDRVYNEYENKIIYPKFSSVFNALSLTTYKNTRCVILGQDPYHGENEANGLAFSVNKDIKVPPSLKNIYKELNDDVNIPIPENGDLTNWAKNGVLLLNSCLTVVKDQPASHKNIGWEQFTDYIIKKLNDKDTPIVFILWGNFAKQKRIFVTNPIHFVISSPHPSPFSANNGFFGSKPFSKTNEFLKSKNLAEIDWHI